MSKHLCPACEDFCAAPMKGKTRTCCFLRSTRTRPSNEPRETMPNFPFFLDTHGLNIEVVHDPELEHRGILRSTAVCGREIALREYDERVLLHEVLHRLIHTNPDQGVGFIGEPFPLTTDEQERLVAHLERGLWEMGWRWTKETK